MCLMSGVMILLKTFDLATCIGSAGIFTDGVVEFGREAFSASQELCEQSQESSALYITYPIVYYIRLLPWCFIDSTPGQ